MAEVSRRALARRDLIEIWTYIAADDVGAADRVLDRIDGALTMLASNPMAGRARPELTDRCRRFPVASGVLIYLPTQRNRLAARGKRLPRYRPYHVR